MICRDTLGVYQSWLGGRWEQLNVKQANQKKTKHKETQTDTQKASHNNLGIKLTKFNDNFNMDRWVSGKNQGQFLGF